MKRLPLPGHHTPVVVVVEAEPDTVITAGPKHLNSLNFQNPQKPPVEIPVWWPECIDHGPPARLRADCNYNITLVHKREEAEQLFLCGTNGKETLCCDLNLSEQSPGCLPSKKMEKIKGSIREFVIKEGEPFALLEQHYVGLVLSRQNEPLRSRLYAFYREKNRDTGLNSDMWIPFVARVCTGDRGGPKNILQYSWTSQMNARLFCGDADSRQHFSELVDVATVHAEQWQDTRVYALFRNEWYRHCVEDSTKIQHNVLRMIESHSEMARWVLPENSSGPLLSNHHSYTHIHGFRNNRVSPHNVLFLSLNNGGIHKVMQNKSQTFIIAEYQPFNHRTHVISISLHPSSGKLYVGSRNELVQLNVANCAQYGDSCELCVLARDPYCGWNGTHCTPETDGTLQDLTHGNHGVCLPASKVQLSEKAFRGSTATHADEATVSVTLSPESKYFLRCPVSSHHAQYSWRHLGSSTRCNWREQQCLLLIDSMGPEQAGAYTCESEEMGHRRVLAQYRLQLEGRAAGPSSSRLIWLCLLAVLVKSLS
ncbi:Semaphorin-7A [Liparis tanakae]|uniref:Semaphorin-7A n=1 Tax=Liparis tanakae TaxID=230148 RepID=A0A4Z2HGC4_9TELE|nr:Semaphorin-7A [Liparis tanakae]